MNETQIRYSFELIKSVNQLVEVRIIGSRTNLSGYFKSVDNILKEIKSHGSKNIYFVLNSISEACYSREQQERLVEKAKNTTTDGDISHRNWLLIDIDPKRSSGVSASNEEKNKAKKTINNVFAYLRNYGFSEPIVCDSGNGFHLLYNISMDNTEENKILIKTFLMVLDMYFSNEDCEIDKTVFNASRITKLYGTIARKGNNTEERPHRGSKIVRVPDKIKETPVALIKKVADLYPKQETPTFQNNYGRNTFDLDEFLSKHNIVVTDKQSVSGATKYHLEHCVFDSNHKGKDAVIFKLTNGAIGYHCFHNSCSGYTWQDVRKLYEPDAYNQNYTRNNKPASIPRITKKADVKPQQEVKDKGKKFMCISEVEAIDRSQIVSIPSGFTALDKKIIGFNKGEVTMWSGKNGSAKSTVLNQIALNAIQAGFKGAIFSGELQAHKLKNWIYLQAAGRQFTKESMYYDNVYYVDKSTSKKIDKWLDGKLYIYNNDYGINFTQLLEDFREIIIKEDLDWVIFDNIMALDLDDNGFNINKQQKSFVLDVSAISKKQNIHSHIVAHPRKDTGFLRKESISGSADLSNAVENVIICHRNNTDYQKAIGDYFPKEAIDRLTMCSNYLEVCKNRDLGVMDFMTGFYYETESKRLLNELHENKVYGWQDDLSIDECSATDLELPEGYKPDKYFEPKGKDELSYNYNESKVLTNDDIEPNLDFDLTTGIIKAPF